MTQSPWEKRKRWSALCRMKLRNVVFGGGGMVTNHPKPLAADVSGVADVRVRDRRLSKS